MAPVTSSVALFGLLGLGVGVGLLLIVAGCRRITSTSDQSPRWIRQWERLRSERGWRPLGLPAVTGIVVGVLTGWVVGAVLAAMAAWALPRILGSNTEHRKQVERIEAVAAWTEMLRDTLGAAAGLEQAIVATARIAPPPIRAEVLELATRLDRDERLTPSLRQLAQQLADPTADLVINALISASEHQARQLSMLLSRLAQIARTRVQMRQRIEASRARTRTTIRVVVITFAVFAGGLIMFNPTFLAPYATATGQLVLVFVGVLFTAALAWMRRMARIDEPERFLQPSDEPTVASPPTRLAVTTEGRSR